MTRSIAVIAREITADWFPVNFAAVPYLRAMHDLTDVTDSYGADSARSVISYFICNATQWRGPTARKIKAELRAMVAR